MDLGRFGKSIRPSQRGGLDLGPVASSNRPSRGGGLDLGPIWCQCRPWGTLCVDTVSAGRDPEGYTFQILSRGFRLVACNSVVGRASRAAPRSVAEPAVALAAAITVDRPRPRQSRTRKISGRPGARVGRRRRALSLRLTSHRGVGVGGGLDLGLFRVSSRPSWRGILDLGAFRKSNRTSGRGGLDLGLFRVSSRPPGGR